MKIPTQIVPNTGGGGLVASRIISTGPCKLFSLFVLNTNAAQQYIQLHESATLPANGAVPKLPSIPVAGGGIVAIDIGGNVGLDLDALVICNSSAAATKTIGAADCAIVAVLGV